MHAGLDRTAHLTTCVGLAMLVQTVESVERTTSSSSAGVVGQRMRVSLLGSLRHGFGPSSAPVEGLGLPSAAPVEAGQTFHPTAKGDGPVLAESGRSSSDGPWSPPPGLGRGTAHFDRR